jgi:hypothetical protein
MLFKNSIRNSKKTQFSIMKINWLTPFKEAVAVYTEYHTKPTNSKCNNMIPKAHGTYTYHTALEA